MELLNNAHHIREKKFGGFASDLEITYPKCAHLLILTESKLDVCTNLQKKHCIEDQMFLLGIELLNNAHHIREMEFGGFASDLEIIYPKGALMLILTDQKWTFAPIY